MKPTPTTYLYFDGNCAEALDFYVRVLDAEAKDVFRNKDASPENQMEGWDELVLHGTLIIGDVTFMVSDSGDTYAKPQGFSVHLELGSEDEVTRVWNALAEGGEIGMPLSQQFWADRFGTLTDRFGIPWMVSYTGGADSMNGM